MCRHFHSRQSLPYRDAKAPVSHAPNLPSQFQALAVNAKERKKARHCRRRFLAECPHESTRTTLTLHALLTSCVAVGQTFGVPIKKVEKSHPCRRRHLSSRSPPKQGLPFMFARWKCETEKGEIGLPDRIGSLHRDSRKYTCMPRLPDGKI